MLIKEEYNKFVNFWNNRKLDTDGVPSTQPYQCADVPKAFQNQLNIKVYPFGSPDGGVWSSGKKVFEGEARCIDPNGGDSKHGRYETQTIDSFLELQKGDYVYFKDTQNNPYGHIGLFDSKEDNNIKVFNQNYSTTYCKFDIIPSNQFAKGLRIIFLKEKNSNNLNNMERTNIQNLIGEFNDILKKPQKHLDNVSNNKTDDFVYDLLLALRNERQNNELKSQLEKSVNDSTTLNKLQHITNIRKVGNDGIAESYDSLVKAIDKLRGDAKKELKFMHAKIENENESGEEIPIRIEKKPLTLNNLVSDISTDPNLEGVPQTLKELIDMIRDLNEKVRNIENNKKK
jgi:hypothetical protein